MIFILFFMASLFILATTKLVKEYVISQEVEQKNLQKRLDEVSVSHDSIRRN